MVRAGAIALSLIGSSFLITFNFLTSNASVTGAVEPVLAAPTHTATATILFVGDMMFDRTIRTDLDRGGEALIFGQAEPLLQRADFTVGNLEGPITTHASHSLGTRPGDTDNTRFTFDPRVAGILAHYGFGLVALGNNHIADFGREGVAETKQYLEHAHILHVGDPFTLSTEPVVMEVQGLTIGFAAYDQFILPNADETRAAILSARALGADFVVVLAHWGDEYEPAPPDTVRALAASFSAAGADLIVGTHSHVIGEAEEIGTTQVYYSLGNFIFDQYWEDSVRCGLAVLVTLTKEGATAKAKYESVHTHLEPGGATSLGCN